MSKHIRENPRGLPCNVVPDNQLWCISGQDGNGGGVIEWCIDRNDAQYELERLKTDTTGRYRNLKAEKYI